VVVVGFTPGKGKIMNASQKLAWFNLAVVVFTGAAVLALLPVLGRGALGGFGLLGLLGFGVLFYRRRHGQVLSDERDALIQKRSWLLAYTVFWVVFVLAAALLAPAVYGEEGGVPVVVAQASVFCAWMLVLAVASVATLVQYAGGAGDAERAE
jgi:hypothetical protein